MNFGKQNIDSKFKTAHCLAIFTIVYNVVEGLVSTVLGFEEETLALFGFGMDSFIESISGFGIAQMIIRISNNPDSSKSNPEIRALKITGISFYVLSAGLALCVINNIVHHHKPETTIGGIIISLVSIVFMWVLIFLKEREGKLLNSPSILADANCTKVCVYMSLVLLISSLLYELTGFEYMDAIGTIGIIYFSIKEGKEAIEKSNGIRSCGCEGGCH